VQGWCDTNGEIYHQASRTNESRDNEKSRDMGSTLPTRRSTKRESTSLSAAMETRSAPCKYQPPQVRTGIFAPPPRSATTPTPPSGARGHVNVRTQAVPHPGTNLRHLVPSTSTWYQVGRARHQELRRSLDAAADLFVRG
jgi:hypothetical protein